MVENIAGYQEKISRRDFLAFAALIGASAVWAKPQPGRHQIECCERRDLFPEGVASGDPDVDSVLLWTRRPCSSGSRAVLRVVVSQDKEFTRIVATESVEVTVASDWTCRVLVGNLLPAHVYWYRFIDDAGQSSRIGRTVTAPADSDPRSVRFAFASCQNSSLGEFSAYRRMIFDDERAPEGEGLGFVLHLGDFVYENVWYPEDRPEGKIFGRRIRDVVRYPHGERIDDFHIPSSLEDYRSLYRAYLHNPDLQDARARWPFVCIWDNHEFSWNGWQSMQRFNGVNRSAQTRKIWANQAWFEFQPARIKKSSGAGLDEFDAPSVRNTPIQSFDENGLGLEPNNRIALESLTGYRALRWGRNLELVITDQRSYRSEEPTGRPEIKALVSADFPELIPIEIQKILDAGRDYGGGRPPTTLQFGAVEIANFRRDEPRQTILGAEQKKWFLQRLKNSQATWKIWGNSVGTLDFRVDPQNLPAGLTTHWPGRGYAGFFCGDYSTAYMERAEIYNFVRDAGITGFVTVCGDRHSFWAGLAAPTLPPEPFEPVGVAFVTGSISTPGFAEVLEQSIPQGHPLRALYVAQPTPESRPLPAINMCVHHGVRSCLEYQRTGDVERARRLSNSELAPHLSFLDLGAHGYATIRISSNSLECEFVCIPRPVESTASPDGGPLLYRVVHQTTLWGKGERPHLEQRIVEGDPSLSL